MKIISQKKVSLKNHPEINEKAIQEYIFEHPEILGLGDLQPIKMEKIQPLGGRLDMLFSDEEDNRYEVTAWTNRSKSYNKDIGVLGHREEEVFTV